MTSNHFTYLGFVIERTEKNGGNLTFKDYASLELAFAQKVSNCLLGYLQLPYHVVTGKKKSCLAQPNWKFFFGLVNKYPIYISLNINFFSLL